MLIKSITIRNLVAFQCAQIRALTLTCDSPLQLILGTNGSGKSSLLNQLSPMPAISTDYLKEGVKDLEIEHKGKTYRLISDFRKKGNAHEFWVDGKNLNDGGTTDVQRELVTSYFGWNNDVHQLCYNLIPFCDMTPSQREAFFMRINPDGIYFLLEKNKRIKSTVGVTKGMLNTLMERKLVLEGEMIDAELVSSLKKEQEQLEHHSKEVYSRLYLLDQETKDIPPNPGEWEDLHNHYQDVSSFFSKLLENYSELSDEELQNLYAQATSDVRCYKEEIILKWEEDCIANEGKRQELSRELGKIEISESKTELEEEILLLQTSYNKYMSHDLTTPLPKHLVDSSHYLEDWERLLTSFHAFEKPLYTRKGINARIHQGQHWQKKLESLNEAYIQVEEEIERLVHTQKADAVTLPDECGKESCVLYNTFMDNQLTLSEKIKHLRQKESQMKKKIERLTEWVKAFSYSLLHLEQMKKCLNELEDMLEKYPEARYAFKSPTLLRDLGMNPMKIYHQLKLGWVQSQEYYKAQEIQKTLEQKQRILERVQERKEDYALHLRKQIEELSEKISKDQQHLSEYRQLCEETVKKAESMKATLEARKTVHKTEEWWTQTQKEYHTYQEYLKKQKEKENLSLDLKNTQERLSEILSILKKQDSVQDRYQTEVLGQITHHEEYLKNLNIVKDALTVLPQKRMIQFLNSLIRKVNQFISRVFTYEFILTPIHELSFKFPYKANGHQAKDISTCSTAQKEMTNLAFTLVCRAVLQLESYPLLLDEVGKTFDITHQRRLLDLLIGILEEHRASQLFVVNHHSLIHSGLSEADILLLHDQNILKPEKYNTHVHITPL